MRSDIPKATKQMIMDAIDKQAGLIKQAEKKELGKMLTKSLMTEYRIMKYVANFRVRYANKLAVQRDRASSVLQKERILAAGKGVETEDEMMNQRGNLELATESYSNTADIAKIRQNASKLNYQKLYFLFFDDIIAWKKKNTTQAVDGKIFLVSIEEVKVEGTVFFLFVI